MKIEAREEASKLISREELLRLLDYNQECGNFHWKVSHPGIPAGSLAGCVDKHSGYIKIGICGVQYSAHRLAWLYVNDRWPINQIDHINGNKADNRIGNLREVTNGQNQQNGSLRKTNSSGHKGVSWDKNTSKWIAYICCDNKQYNLGYYLTIAEAVAARTAGEKILHGEYARSALPQPEVKG